MKQSVALAMFALIVGSMFALIVGSSSSSVRAEQGNSGGPLRLNVPMVQAPAPMNRPKQESQIPKQIRSVPALGNVGAVQDGPQQRSRTDGNAPSSVVQQVRPRAVHREVARRITIAGGVLVLPEVAYYGAPVILNVPGVGYVDVPEDEYARLYEKLSSSVPEQVEEAMSSLRRIKALEEAEVEAHERGPERTGPSDVQDLSGRLSKEDLSEPIFFHSKGQTRSRRLY
jgi:hypothetical protein